MIAPPTTKFRLTTHELEPTRMAIELLDTDGALLGVIYNTQSGFKLISRHLGGADQVLIDLSDDHAKVLEVYLC